MGKGMGKGGGGKGGGGKGGAAPLGVRGRRMALAMAFVATLALVRTGLIFPELSAASLFTARRQELRALLGVWHRDPVVETERLSNMLADYDDDWMAGGGEGGGEGEREDVKGRKEPVWRESSAEAEAAPMPPSLPPLADPWYHRSDLFTPAPDSSGPAIPKIIHQTWPTSAVTLLPANFQRYHARWRQLHPDWHVRIWSDDDMLELVEA